MTDDQKIIENTTCLYQGTAWESRVKPLPGAVESGEDVFFGYHIAKEGFAEHVLFQNGPVPKAGHNGVTVEELLTVCMKRLAGLQSMFGCAENFAALKLIGMARNALTERTERRIAAKLKGEEKEAELPYRVPFSHPAIAELVEEGILKIEKFVAERERGEEHGARIYTVEMLPDVPEFTVGVQATYHLTDGDIGDATKPPRYDLLPPQVPAEQTDEERAGARFGGVTIQCGNPKEVGLNGTNLTAAGIIKLCEADRLNYGTYPHWANDVTIWAECASLRAQGERIRERFNRGVLGERTQ